MCTAGKLASLILAWASLHAAGCAHYEPLQQSGRVVAPAQGRLFLVRQLAGSSLWVCDATGDGGGPVCYEGTSPPQRLYAAVAR